MSVFSTKKFLELFLCLTLVIAFYVLRLNNKTYDHKSNSPDDKKRNFFNNTRKNSISTATPAPDLKIPWRYHSNNDGFAFPREVSEIYLTYEPINRSLTRQLLQFENAVVFAYFLQRVLIVPPITLLKGDNKTIKIAMSSLINFDLLSTKVRLVEMSMRINYTKAKERLSIKTTYEVCQDPRLGFWLDYIPSVENINSWRTLKQQLFSPLKLRFDYHNRTEYWCPGTENYFARWGPPLQIKALYRGMITELFRRKEDLIVFQSSTLDTTETRFFDRDRVRTAQEILLYYIRFSKRITRLTKQLTHVLGKGYIAILANGLSANATNGLNSFLVDNLKKKKTLSKTLFIVSGSLPKFTFRHLRNNGYRLVFADTFIESIRSWSSKNKELSHIFSLLLCAYANHFIGFPGTSDLYFIEHLRLQDVKVLDGLVAENINVKWAKHTVKKRADDKKVLQNLLSHPKPSSDKETSKTKDLLKSRSIFNESVPVHPIKKPGNRDVKITKDSQLNSIACTFCNYISYVTGKRVCPTMKMACSKKS